MELRRFIRTGIAASAAGHLSILAMVLIFAEVHPFGSVTAETIAVDLVSPDEAKPAPKVEQTPPAKADPSDAFNLSSKSAPSSNPAPAPEAAVQPQKVRGSLRCFSVVEAEPHGVSITEFPVLRFRSRADSGCAYSSPGRRPTSR